MKKISDKKTFSDEMHTIKIPARYRTSNTDEMKKSFTDYAEYYEEKRALSFDEEMNYLLKMLSGDLQKIGCPKPHEPSYVIDGELKTDKIEILEHVELYKSEKIESFHRYACDYIMKNSDPLSEPYFLAKCAKNIINLLEEKDSNQKLKSAFYAGAQLQQWLDRVDYFSKVRCGHRVMENQFQRSNKAAQTHSQERTKILETVASCLNEGKPKMVAYRRAAKTHNKTENAIKALCNRHKKELGDTKKRLQTADM